MSAQHGNAPENGAQEEAQTNGNGNAPDNRENMIPKSRFDEVNAKRKAAEETLSGVVDELLEDIPEDMRDLVPDLAPAERIKWIRAASKKGLFAPRESHGPDSDKAGGGKKPPNYEAMSPLQMREAGYK